MRRAPSIAPTLLAATLLSCAAPEHVSPAPIDVLPPLPVEDASINTTYWLHRGLDFVPRVTASALYDARLPDEVGFVVAFNRGSHPEDFGAAGLGMLLSWTLWLHGASGGRADTNSLVVFSTTGRLLAWLPIEFVSTSATGNVLVLPRD
jgi:hypothetical protein